MWPCFSSITFYIQARSLHCLCWLTVHSCMLRSCKHMRQHSDQIQSERYRGLMQWPDSPLSADSDAAPFRPITSEPLAKWRECYATISLALLVSTSAITVDSVWSREIWHFWDTVKDIVLKICKITILLKEKKMMGKNNWYLLLKALYFFTGLKLVLFFNIS